MKTSHCLWVGLLRQLKKLSVSKAKVKWKVWFVLQDVELNELRATINSLRHQNFTNMTADSERCQSPSSSSHSNLGHHYRSSDSVKSDPDQPAWPTPVFAGATSAEHVTKKHKSWVRSVCKKYFYPRRIPFTVSHIIRFLQHFFSSAFV